MWRRHGTIVGAALAGSALVLALTAAPPAAAVAEFSFVYGNPGDVGIMGDWDGNGSDTPAVVRGDTWWL